MKYTDTELETILSKLIASTRSPRGRFSAVASYPQLEKRLKPHIRCFGRNSIFIYATDFTPNSIHNGRNT